MKKVLIVILVLFALVGCSDKIDGEKIYKTIESELATEFVENEKALLIDIRSNEEFEQDHIAEAINIPLDTISEKTLADVTTSKIDNIIIYGADSEQSKKAAIQILELGYSNVYDLGVMANWGNID